MAISVTVENGRLVVSDNGKFLFNSTGDYIDAATNGKIIIAVKKGGRVQELRMNGQFVKDILPGGAIGIQLSGDALLVKKSDGRTERYENGKFKSSSGS